VTCFKRFEPTVGIFYTVYLHVISVDAGQVRIRIVRTRSGLQFVSEVEKVIPNISGELPCLHHFEKINEFEWYI